MTQEQFKIAFLKENSICSLFLIMLIILVNRLTIIIAKVTYDTILKLWNRLSSK
jgi:hypothetical protein